MATKDLDMPLTETKSQPTQAAAIVAYWPPTLSGPPLDPGAWVECTGEDLLASIPSWKPITEVPQGEQVEAPSTDPGDDQARAQKL